MRRAARDNSEDEHDEDDGDDEKEDEEAGASKYGLRSRRAMHKIYEITSQNDAERRRGLGDAFMTVSDMDELLLRAWIMAGAGNI